nr:TIGR03749 family integrating conjugative element protein [Azoarcus taiwanensis]
VLYLVTRGRGLAQSLLPAIHRFDPAAHLPQPETEARAVEGSEDSKEAGHAQ